MFHADRAARAALVSLVSLAGAAPALGAPADRPVDLAAERVAEGAVERPVDRIDVHAERPGLTRYDGHQVVRVAPETARQLSAVGQIADSIWTERPGVGPIDIQVAPGKIEILRQLGLEPQVLIEDVQQLIDREWNEIRVADFQQQTDRPLRTGTFDPAFYQTFQQLPDIHARMNAIATARPDLASVSDIGDALEDIGGGDRRDILAIRVTGPDQPGNLRDDRPIIFWQGGQHAREWVSPATVIYLADMLVELYDTDPRVRSLMDSIDFRIVPVVNPDGYVYTWTDQRLWRKNRRNGYGVDLNRNWSFEWGGTGSSGSTSSDTYRGPSPFSEPETAAIRDYTTAFGPRLASAIDYHCFSQLILWPYGYESGAFTPEPDRTFYDDLSRDMSAAIQSESGRLYDPIQSWRLYPAAGVADDWFYGALGAYSLTIELRDDEDGPYGFVLPAEQILPTAEENFQAALLFAERTALPLSIILSSTMPQRVPADQTTAIEVGILNGTESVDPATATIHTAIDGGSFTSAPMTALGAALFEGTLPAAPCGSTVSYYFTAQTTAGSTASYPPGGATSPLTAESTVETLSFADDAETDLGWTVGAPGDTATTGVWERGDPTGTAAQPENDRSPDGTLCWITGADATSLGSNDVDAGITTLTSPVFDATEPETMASYWRWFSNDQGAEPNLDVMTVEISDDAGASWTTLEVVNENTTSWVFREFRVGDYVSNTAQTQVRFVVGDLDGGSIVEAGIDDVRVAAFGCPTSSNPADIDGDGDVDPDDINAFVAAFTDSIPDNADIDNDGDEDPDDITAFVNAFTGA